jgi:hypothetical protein
MRFALDFPVQIRINFTFNLIKQYVRIQIRPQRKPTLFFITGISYHYAAFMLGQNNALPWRQDTLNMEILGSSETFAPSY